MTSKVPMALASANLTRILEVSDEAELTTAMVEMFNETRLDLKDAIDRRICFFDIAKGKIETMDRIAEDYKRASKIIANAVDRLKANTQQIMESNPELPYEGNLGRFSLQASKDSVEYMIPVRRLSANNVITEKEITEHNIDQKFITMTQFYQINSEAVREHLTAGGELTWSRLEKNKHLRTWKQ